MKIIVCIKQVPDTTEVRLDPRTNTLIRQGVPSIINPDDKSGIEVALQMKEAHGAHVTVLSMGPPQAEVALQEALAMGCDEAVLLTGKEFSGSDTYATATILAAAIKQMDYDLVITGRQAIDGDTAQVGPQLAEQLAIPQVTYAEEIKYDGQALTVKRWYEDASHLCRVRVPCLITVLSDVAEPRYMTVQGTVEAFEKDIQKRSFDDLKDHLNPEWIGLQGSPTKVVKSFPKQAKAAGLKMVDLSVDEAVDRIISELEGLHLI